MNSHDRQTIALRYWFLGAGFYRAADALEYAAGWHTGTRKDGVTPELSHQVQITSHVRTLLPHLRYKEEALCVALLHDVREDYHVEDAVIRERYGDLVADGVDTMTKEFRGVRRDDVTLFQRMAENPISSVIKPADRTHNQHTMVGVFSQEKVAEYVAETRELFIPMIKTARRAFPDQEPAYENLKLMLNTQLNLLDAWMKAQAADASQTAA